MIHKIKFYCDIITSVILMIVTTCVVIITFKDSSKKNFTAIVSDYRGYKYNVSPDNTQHVTLTCTAITFKVKGENTKFTLNSCEGGNPFAFDHLWLIDHPIGSEVFIKQLRRDKLVSAE